MIGLELRGIEREIAALKAKQKALGRASLNAIRRVIRRRITGVKQEIKTETGIGRSIWGGEKKGEAGSSLSPLVSLIRARISGDFESIETGIKLKGLAKMIEEGGRLKAHVITPKLSPFLVFDAGGRTVFARKVSHPGAQVRAHNIADKALQAAEPEIVREIDAAVGALLRADGEPA